MKKKSLLIEKFNLPIIEKQEKGAEDLTPSLQPTIWDTWWRCYV
jgi:hypothetical protein